MTLMILSFYKTTTDHEHNQEIKNNISASLTNEKYSLS